MLFVLTGDVQIGKTRWLLQLVARIEEEGVVPYGVLAPGEWVDRRNEKNAGAHVDAHGFEKLGILNELLPQHERIRFAQRADLAQRTCEFDPTSQSARAGLQWHISDTAIDCVNAHFQALASEIAQNTTPGLVIVDELGQLELKRNGGLTQAVALLNAGPTKSVQHALIVVRKTLLPLLENKFEQWGSVITLEPNEAASAAILEALALSH